MTALGTLLTLPLEVRDKIYGLVLDFSVLNSDGLGGRGYSFRHRHPDFKPRSGILRVSRHVHVEAIKALYTVNEFQIVLCGYEGRGYELEISNNRSGTGFESKITFETEMLKHVRNWQLLIAPGRDSERLFGFNELNFIQWRPRNTTYK